MSETTYYIRFEHFEKRTGVPYEEQEYTTASAAWEAFRLFIEPSSLEIYSRVELVEYNWSELQEYPLAQVTFL